MSIGNETKLCHSNPFMALNKPHVFGIMFFDNYFLNECFIKCFFNTIFNYE
jgi:hypothetical protein